MNDRLGHLLGEHECLWGIICRDPTMIELELIARAGYHVVWLDLEHGAMSNETAVDFSRTIIHLGMVPLVRIPELSRSHVQVLLDGGVQILTLPDVRTVKQAAEFVKLGKYPPLGERGVASSSANFDYRLEDPARTLCEANAGTRLMVMIENDEGLDAVDGIVGTEGIDMLTIGPADWGASNNLYGAEAREDLALKIDRVLEAAAQAGKTVAAGVFDPEQVGYYRDRGTRIIFTGVDVNLKRDVLEGTINQFQKRVGG